jgi:hypoxanthine phosphoribosyltransferase
MARRLAGMERSGRRDGKPLVMLVILKGAYVFAADLSRALGVPHEVEFIRVQSYRGRKRGALRIAAAPPREAVAGRRVLVVDGIFDSGATLRAVLGWLRRRGPASVRVCVLLEKKRSRIRALPLDAVGFRIPDGFVVGYGMDAGGAFRNLPDVRLYAPASRRRRRKASTSD